MNRLYKIALGLIVCFPFVACNEDEDKGASFSLDKSEITFGAEGGADVLLVESNDSWTVSVSEPWLSVSPASGTGNAACHVVVDSSLVSEMRTASLRFTPSAMPAMAVTVKQMGYGKMIIPDTCEIWIEASAKMEERYFETTVTTNVEFSVEVDHLGVDQEWLTADEVTIELDK